MAHATMVVRAIGPADRELLLDGFARLSAESRYHRFFTPKLELTPGEVRYLTQPDGVSHFALGAAARRKDGSLRGLAVARYVRAHDDDRVAHVALAVVDEAQRHGLGAYLLRGIAHAALLREVERFRFTVLPANVPMRTLLAFCRAPMIVQDGRLVAEVPTFALARLRPRPRLRALLERAGR